MLNRRWFTGGLGAAVIPARAIGQTSAPAAIPFYSAAGPKLTRFSLDVGTTNLSLMDSLTLPANIQYAWPHPSRRFLYVVASNGQPGSGPMGATGADKNHYAIALRVGPDGAVEEHGQRKLLPSRPIHCTTDQAGRFLFTAHNIPSRVTVHHLALDGVIGDEVPQDSKLDFGIYAHQVRLTPGDKTLLVCSRGNDAAGGKPEDPGHIEVFSVRGGKLAPLQTIRPGAAGLGFGPRHLDISPDGRFVHVSLERQNSLAVFGLKADGTLTPEPLFVKSAITDPQGKEKHPGQGVGPIHVHPNGRFVYQTNRGSGTMMVAGKQISNGGENNIVVWAVNPATGEPSLVQRAWTDDYELRTFAMDPSGQILIAASTTPMMVHEQDVFSIVSAGLSVYRMGADGKLTSAHKYDVDTSGGLQFWAGTLTMA